MKARGWIAAVAAVALAAVAVWWWKGRGDDPARATSPGAARTAAAPDPLRPIQPPRAPGTPAAGEVAPGPEGVVAIDPDQVLAQVNGVAIKLGDLMVVEPGTRGPQQVEAASLRYLLDRAIDRELVNQAARAKGVTLDATQQAHLDEVRDQLKSPGPGVVADLTRTPAYVAFDVRDTEGLMLQTNLVAKSGAPSPHVLPADVDGYYKAHEAEFPPLPVDPGEREQAWGKVESSIRAQLATSQTERYQQAVAAFMRELRAGAAIVESDVALGRR